MIVTLPERIAALPPEQQQICAALFDVAVLRGRAEPPPSMWPWVEQQFGSLDAVRNQTIVRVVNRLTLEAALFNPLRARRPLAVHGGDAELEAQIHAALAEHDIFREPLLNTTADVFGRVVGQHCISASNVAKFDGWHGLLIFNEPHPLRINGEHLSDCFATALRWFQAAHAEDPQAQYPLIFWNCLPKAGASQMHGHIQLTLGSGMHYAHIELWRRAMAAYHAEHQRSYIADLHAIHNALGLGLALPNGVAGFVHLTPLRNREIVLLGDPATPEQTMHKLGEALGIILQHWRQRGVLALNLCIALPPLGDTPETWYDMPILLRIGDRGDPLASADLGANELYATGSISVDPFEIAAQHNQAFAQIPCR